MLGALWSLCVVRGVLLGSKAMFRDMVDSCERENVQPVMDDVVFSLGKTDEAYEGWRSKSIFRRWSSIFLDGCMY